LAKAEKDLRNRFPGANIFSSRGENAVSRSHGTV